MSRIVSGFQNMVWCVQHFESNELISEERFRLDDMPEEAIVKLLEQKAKEQLSAREIVESPHLYQAKKDDRTGNRLIYSAGMNPYFSATLWRADEVERRDAERNS